MDIDERIREAFSRRVDAMPPRAPRAGETARALGRNGVPRGAVPTGSAVRRASLAELASLAALAAAALAVAVLPADRLSRLRPLASELAAVADDAGGERVLDLVFAAGESYRSFKQR